MRIDKYRKKKMKWTINYVFGDLCYKYFNTSKINISMIVSLEKILFLMQNESLEKYGVPLIPYEIYYFNNQIYIKYLSDLLRVSHPKETDLDDKAIKINEKYRYNDMLPKYKQLSEEELNAKIEMLIRSRTLNFSYFKFEQCKRITFYRKCARFQMSSLGGIFMLFALICWGGVLILFLTIVMLVYELISGVHIYPMNEGIGAIIIASPSFLICFLLIKKMIKPTKTEKKLVGKLKK